MLAIIFNGGSNPDQTQQSNNDDLEEDSSEDSEGDGLETLEPSEILFPRDPES